jgi:hypothetical protein
LFQRDYILRMIDQAAQAMARAVGLLLQHKVDDAERELAAAYSALALDRTLIGVLDAATLAHQLGDDERVKAAVRVLLCDAQLQRQRGDNKRAKTLLRCGQGLLQRLTTADAALVQELERAMSDG